MCRSEEGLGQLMECGGKGTSGSPWLKQNSGIGFPARVPEASRPSGGWIPVKVAELMSRLWSYQTFELSNSPCQSSLLNEQSSDALSSLTTDLFREKGQIRPNVFHCKLINWYSGYISVSCELAWVSIPEADQFRISAKIEFLRLQSWRPDPRPQCIHE